MLRRCPDVHECANEEELLWQMMEVLDVLRDVDHVDMVIDVHVLHDIAVCVGVAIV